ncbi:hypothetical protein [Streptomyces venezuelae]|uniref:hypothetical protein n=1 Tax=Streptomyces venezuelae TaxID=54571 RepID=UPI001684F50E|nr:hypothetical protein [Streptomyces venezuelae]
MKRGDDADRQAAAPHFRAPAQAIGRWGDRFNQELHGRHLFERDGERNGRR